MSPRQARRERREAERKAKKLELKKSRLAENDPLAAVSEPSAYLDSEFPRDAPTRPDPSRDVEVRNNATADRISLKAGLPIPPPGSSAPAFTCAEDVRACFLAERRAAATAAAPSETNELGFVSQTTPTEPRLTRSGAFPTFVRQNDPEPGFTPGCLPGFVSQNKPPVSTKRAEINRANAQHSTGPRSSTGKFAASRNSTKHGLASGTLIIPGEDPAAFEALLNDLLDEHQPATPSEELLIQGMAQSHWLGQRAIRLQNSCFTEEGVDHERTGRLVPVVRVNESRLALYLRYGATYHRAFHKALADLQRLQKERRKVERGFVSQSAAKTVTPEKFLRQNDPSPGPTSGFVSQTTARPDENERSEAKKQAA